MSWEETIAVSKGDLWNPNRETPEARLARAGTVFMMITTVALLFVIAVGGWSTLQGGRPLHIAFMVVYAGLAYFVGRWNRGVLPVISGIAMTLAVFALVAGTAWFARDKSGFNDPALPEFILGVCTLSLIPAQMLLIVVAMWGFSQKWNVEELTPGAQRSGSPLRSRGDGDAVAAS